MKSFSLLTLLLLVLIAALVVSHLVMMQQLGEARREVEIIRRRYGHIRVEDPTKAYVSRIVENEPAADAYRVIVPAGSRYLLHLSDATIDSPDPAAPPTPTKTISLNDWRDGADAVISCTVYWENKAPRVVVHTESEKMFDYVLPDWTGGSGPAEWSHLQANAQTEFSPDETIAFVCWRHTGVKRGIMLWLEPHATWQARSKLPRSVTP